jgi:ribosomal protein L29
MIKKNENIKDVAKMKDEIFNLRKNLMNLNFQKSSGQCCKTSGIRNAKKEIARLKTKITELDGVKNA